MPLRAEIQVHLPLSLRDQLPQDGSLVRSRERGSNAVFRLLGVRRIAGDKKRVLVRLTPIPRADRVGLDELVHSWPRHPRPGKPVSRETLLPGPIVTTAQRTKAQRQRAVDLLIDDRTDQLVPAARLQNKTAVEGEWRDPDDHNPNRREPRVIHGVRANDAVDYFTARGTFNKRQGSAARRLKEQSERADGVRIGYDRMTNVGTGFGPSAGLSEQQMAAIEAFEKARAAVGPSLWEIVSWVILQNLLLKDFARRNGLQPYQAQPRLLGALDKLADHYKALDDGERREALHA